MKRSWMESLSSVALVASMSWTACTDGTHADASSTGGETSAQSSASAGGAGATATSTTGTGDPFAQCAKGELESDRAEDIPLTGPGVDSSTGALAAGHYVVAATYLALLPEQTSRAKELGAAVIGSLSGMHGLVAFSVSSSSSCASLRTLTAWQTEEDMVAFVMSPAHASAMAQISSLSRGTSDTISWQGDETSVTWPAAAAELASKPSGN